MSPTLCGAQHAHVVGMKSQRWTAKRPPKKTGCIGLFTRRILTRRMRRNITCSSLRRLGVPGMHLADKQCGAWHGERGKSPAAIVARRTHHRADHLAHHCADHLAHHGMHHRADHGRISLERALDRIAPLHVQFWPPGMANTTIPAPRLGQCRFLWASPCFPGLGSFKMVCFFFAVFSPSQDKEPSQVFRSIFAGSALKRCFSGTFSGMCWWGKDVGRVPTVVARAVPGGKVWRLIVRSSRRSLGQVFRPTTKQTACHNQFGPAAKGA